MTIPTRAPSYRVAGLHPGDYYVCFSTDINYSNECYGTLGNIYYNPNAGAIVSVTAGKTTENVDLYWGPDPRTYLPVVAR